MTTAARQRSTRSARGTPSIRPGCSPPGRSRPA
uniref:Uncharacterized protein n=1 Tax=Arundo donax TaxID=35708 RepID=A0A0A9HYR4_ARUDO